MANAWIEFIKKISRETGKSYKEAMSIASDRKKKGNMGCMTKTAKSPKKSKKSSKKNKSSKKRKHRSTKRR